VSGAAGSEATPRAARAVAPLCVHCGAPVPAGAAHGAFCCTGCEGAHQIVSGLGLEAFYRRRALAAGSLKPEADAGGFDFAAHAHTDAKGITTLHLMVDGVTCAACVWLIEQVLAREPDVISARLSLTTRRLALRWRGPAARAGAFSERINTLGFRVAPFDPAVLATEEDREEHALLRALGIAGFAAANVMLVSVAVWVGHSSAAEMGQATRDLMHWVAALIALPAIAIAGLPFYRSALAALARGRTNMDVPISLGVLLTAGMSLSETIRSGPYAYFDSACALLFFLLIGRYLDRRARGRARGAATQLLALGRRAVHVLGADGIARPRPAEQVRAGEMVLAAAGERIGVDGVVRSGLGSVDASLVTGESLPQPVRPGTRVFAGMLNLGAPLRIETTATGPTTLLAEIVRLMEQAEQGRSRFVAFADRVSRWYAPVVHLAALSTFAFWVGVMGLGWQPALVYAVAVLIITCPCALAIAVPAAQVAAVGRLMKRGVLVKSGTALERLATADHAVFDKTGTLTLGRPSVIEGPDTPPAELLREAAGLAAASRHPLARALVRAAGPAVPVLAGVVEHPGEGLSAPLGGGSARLGSRRFCGVPADPGAADDGALELWYARPGRAPMRFAFTDAPRADAADTVRRMRGLGLGVELISGDRPAPAAAVARAVGIESFAAQQDPAAKVARLEALRAAGKRVLMVGDGLNDAPALAAASVSISPATAADISQTAADLVFQGDRLGPVAEAIAVARRAHAVARQNVAFAILYNFFAVPLAIAGMVTPLIAAAAMTSSSLVVILNALRLERARIAPGEA